MTVTDDEAAQAKEPRPSLRRNRASMDAAFRAASPAAMAALLRGLGTLDRAEDAFQEACLRALAHWPEHGPPHDPTSWLVRVGRNAGIDRLRRHAREARLPTEHLGPATPDEEDRRADALDQTGLGDDVLRLLFICCHPDLAPAHQIALALRVVCGLSVPEIARVFLMGEAAMEQRITRAKRRVAQAGLPFEAPAPRERQARLSTVSAMVYLIFTEGHSVSAQESGRKAPLCLEAIRLGRLLAQLFPEEPEVLGLLALMLLHDARAPARFSGDGAIVLLEDQDRRLWNRAAIAEGTALTNRAFRMHQPGPYQLQAAIAALHARAPDVDRTDWVQIEQLYGVLADMEPTPVVILNHAVALSRAKGPAEALARIAPLAQALAGYFHYHAVRGHLLERSGAREEAYTAYACSLDLAPSAAEAAQVRLYMDRLAAPTPVSPQ